VSFKQAVNHKLTRENAILKRLKFAAQSEKFSAEQKSLLDETLDSDLAAVAAGIEALQPAKAADERHPPWREKLSADRAQASSTLVAVRLRYFGSASPSRRNQCFTVLRLSPVRRLISRMESHSSGAFS
jgi:hypothetical protein